MPRILSRNKFLVGSLCLFLFAGGIFLIQWSNYNATLNYFGNNLLGNGFWLHPQNTFVKGIKKYEAFKGVISSINRTSDTKFVALGIEPYKNAPLEEEFNFSMPTKVDLNNAYMFDTKNPNVPPEKLGESLIDSIPASSEIEIELQSDWNSNSYQQVTKLIIRK